MKKTFALLISLISSAHAQEICFTCSGTYWLRAQGHYKEQTDDRHAFGLCLDRSSMNITYDTEGSLQTKWRFTKRESSSGTTYYYWNKEYENFIFGRVKEQIELSDIKQGYQYAVKDKNDMPVMAVNGQCTVTQRIGK
jgi:hypothetical protein